MNHKQILRSFGFIGFTLIILLLSLLLTGFSLYAEETNSAPKMSLGAGGSYSYYDVHHRYGEYPKWKGGFGYGGGLIFENMFTGTFGIHSGIWYSQMGITLESPEDNSSSTGDVIVKQKIKSNLITIPVYLITSLGSRSISFSILTGMNFSAILSSHLESETGGSEDVKKYLGTGQLGIGGGIEIKIRATRFTGFFISGIAEYYLTDLVSEVSETTDFIYDFQIRSGFLLFTF